MTHETNGKRQMNRILHTSIAAIFGISLVACGGGETGQEMEGEDMAATETAEGGEAAAGELSIPDFMQVDHDARTVSLDIVAGESNANNRWNFNGHSNGDATIVVPVGYEVTVDFRNADPNNPHSLGIDARTGGTWPATFDNPTPAFEGAITTGAASLTEATQPDASETITFTASQAGSYTMVCYVPAHAATGMWIGFEVSADGQAGVRMQAM